MSDAKTIKAALLDWIGSKHLEFKPGWDTRGRPWSGGLRGVIVHDLVGVDQGAVDWTYAPQESMPYCNSVTTQDKVVVNSVLSCWHSGLGGPWPAVGVPQDQGSYFLWGIEHTTWGAVDDITDLQAELTAKTICALKEAAGPKAWPNRRPFTRVIRHASWTDGGAELGLNYWLRTKGRKVDTKRPLADWREDARAMWKTRH
jgi:hypothetical protein